MKRLGIIGLFVIALVLSAPLSTNARKKSEPTPTPTPTPAPAPVPPPPPSTSGVATLTVTPLIVAPGETLTIFMDPSGSYVHPFFWFTKGSSEQALASWSFGCYQTCVYPRTSTYVIPTTWPDGSDYYVKIYDSGNDTFTKANFTVKR